MKKITVLLSFLLVFSILFTACNNGNTPANNNTDDGKNPEPVNPINVNVLGLKGPTSIGMIKLIDEKALNSDKYIVDYTTVEAPDIITGKIINNEVQIAAVPTNLAAVLFNKTEGKVQFLAQNTLGVLYAVGKGDITSLEELQDKKVSISGKGSVPEYAMNYILSQKGLADKVSLDYLPDHASVAQALLAGDIDVAILPQPFVTQVQLKNPEVKILIDLNKEWEVASNKSSVLSMGCLVINKEFAENNPDFVSEFLNLYEQSVNFVNSNPAQAAELVAKNEIINNAALVEKAIPYCNIVYKNAQDAKDEINAFLKVLFDSDNKSVGGKLPDESFYYKK
jgi:NitT/TauT family transport system substrate-binding protein